MQVNVLTLTLGLNNVESTQVNKIQNKQQVELVSDILKRNCFILYFSRIKVPRQELNDPSQWELFTSSRPEGQKFTLCERVHRKFAIDGFQ